MVSRSEAIAVVDAILRRDGHDEVVVQVAEHENCWSLVAQSRAWVQTQEMEDMLVGRGPFIVEKLTGRVHPTGSALSTEAAVAAFEKWGDPYGPPPIEQPHLALLQLVSDGRGRRSTRALELYARRRGAPWAPSLAVLLRDLHRRELVESSDDLWALSRAGERELQASEDHSG